MFIFFTSLKLEPQTEKTIEKPATAGTLPRKAVYPDGIRGAKAPLP